MPSPTKKLTKLAFFLALALVFHLLEAIMIPPLPLVGVRLGLANVVTMAGLELFGMGPTFTIAMLRVLLGSILTATFGTTAFWLSLAGAVASLMVMGLLARVSKPKFGFLGLSVAGAMSHNWAQLLTYSLIANFSGFNYYLVLLAGAAIPTGMVVAYLAYQLCRLEGRSEKW